MAKKKKAPPALENVSDNNGEQEEEKDEQEPPVVPSAQPLLPHMELMEVISNMLDNGNEEEETLGQLPEAIANMRAALGAASDSDNDVDQEVEEPHGRLSAAMVSRRHRRRRQMELGEALGNLQETHGSRNLANATLLSWQENNSRLAHRQDPEAQASRASQERQLQDDLEQWDQRSAAARLEYQAALVNFRMMEQQLRPPADLSDNPEDSSEVVSDDSSDTSEPSRGNKKEATVTDDCDDESHSSDTVSLEKEKEGPLTKRKIDCWVEEHMRRLKARTYQTRATTQQIQRQIELDAENAMLQKKHWKELADADRARRQRIHEKVQGIKQRAIERADQQWRDRAARNVAAPCSQPIPEQVESRPESSANPPCEQQQTDQQQQSHRDENESDDDDDDNDRKPTQQEKDAQNKKDHKH
jgi:hypothetical protein